MNEQELFSGHGEVAHDWRYDSPTDDLIITGTDKNWSLVVPYQIESADEVEFGIAALSGADGSVQWSHKVGAGQDAYGEDSAPVPWVATEKVVITRPVGDEPTLDDPVTAIDAATGEVLWSKPLEGWPFLADGDTVLGGRAESFNGRPWNDDVYSPMTAMAWDAATGEKSWDLSKRYETSKVATAADGITVVEAEKVDEVFGGLKAVETATGDKVAELANATGGCETDGTTTIVCKVVDGIATMDLADRAVTYVHDPEIADDRYFDVEAVYHGQIFAKADSTDSKAHDRYLLDADANVLADGVPGYLLAIDAGFAVFADSEDRYPNGGVSMYRMHA